MFIKIESYDIGKLTFLTSSILYKNAKYNTHTRIKIKYIKEIILYYNLLLKKYVYV